MTICSRCGMEFGIGQWYDCPHGHVVRQDAAVHRRQRAVKFYHPKHGWRTPGRSDRPMPERLKDLGFQRVEFDSLSSLRQHARDTGARAEVLEHDSGSGSAEKEYTEK